MALTIIVLLAVEIGGLLLIYVVLRERLRRAASAAAQSRELREEVGRLVVDLNQTTDRNIALVEDAIARLNELLGRTDKKIGLLRREAEKHDGGLQLYSRLAEAKPSPVAAPTAPRPRGGAPARELAPAGGAVALGAGDARSEVARLARQGFAPSLIAARLGVPLGEVELIVSLDRRQAPAEDEGGEAPDEQSRPSGAGGKG